MYDLKSEDPEEPGLPDEYHGYQPLLLRHTFKPTNCDPDEVFIGADLNLYYDLRHLNWYKRPDWFAVVGVSRLYEGSELRNSYVMWQELVSPFVVVELLSPGTEDEDLGRTVRQLGKPPTKWQVYEQILRVPYYFVFSRYTNELQAFRLVGGAYESLDVGDEGLLITQLGLRLGLWQGRYENIERLWLRWFTASGELILTPSEEAATAQARVAQAEQRAERLAAKLRELNIDPDELE
ncbi:MAG: Uma2 family endonuclease [Symplocastrum torsivum CPER-KK1]|jgi:Uma2 family endonuclease|uniref:Uma2 family endonuclease n=1 Tax=Symplocastrum torsivum CPER-KK1 TaxID=450513 RepID=A0A951PR02_9CYAN|nr:Uma2 family endonuclease [Symplocastrum torsivum CPER-KK1]